MNTITPKYTNLSNVNYSPTFNALPKGYIKVDDYLIRGPHPSIKNLWTLKQEGVNQVFDFRHLSNFGCKFIERFACKLFGISYKRIPFSYLSNKYPSLSSFEKVSASVKQNGEKGGITLFHCNSSRHRTSHFSAFYLLTKGEPLNTAAQQPDFKQKAAKIIKNQIIDKNYFNRKFKNYNGRNPIQKITAKINNQIIIGTYQAHKYFLKLINQA